MKKSQLQELIREVLSENEEKALGLAIKREFEKELADDGQLDEAIDPVSILGYFLAGNTVTNMVSKFFAKKLRKFGWDKAANKAQWLADKTHHLEEYMIKSIEGWLSFVIKDPNTRAKVAKGLFAVLLGYLGTQAGISAVDAIQKSQEGSAAMSLVKGALKGKDIKHVLSAI